MMKKNSYILILFFAIMFFTSCGSAKEPSASIVDREGNSIYVKENIDSIISFSPNITQILVDLGLKDKLIGIDSFSFSNDVYNDDIAVFEDMLNPDMEVVLSLAPDIIFSSSMNKSGDDNAFSALKDAEIPIAYIPSSQSVLEIQKDIEFIASVVDKENEGAKLIKNMDKSINKVKEIGKTIKNKKTVYFEISPAPSMYSFGMGVFLDDLINIAGGENILADQKEWVAVSEEIIPKRNPDVILTNQSYSETDPVKEIKSRNGWEHINAIKNNEVYLVDANTTSLANHKITDALIEIAKLIYPKEYSNYED